MTSNVLENLSKLVRKSSQNTSKIDLEGGLEAAREPPLCGGDPKTSFLAILAPLGDPFGDQFWLILARMLPELSLDKHTFKQKKRLQQFTQKKTNC